ncbi:stage II sporulation protein E [Streptomyces sp. TLI_185]|nr:stage II sporulation protein E [Streptomyces sp. TLI_185]
MVGEPEPIDDSPAGTAFLQATTVEVPGADGVRMYLPLLDGSDQVGVMALTLDTVDDNDRRLLRILAGLVADMLVTKHSYTDQFFRARRREPMSVAAEIHWSLLPPLAMAVPQIAVAGILEPAYDVAGDSFDYALNEDILHVAMVDAMGHGLDAATMATVAVGAYRHARRADIGLSEIYAFMDRAIAEQFGPDPFVTAQMMRLNIATGHLQWVNAGHPAPLLIHDHRVVRQLAGPTTLPVGFGGEEPRISGQMLQRGDRVLCFTDSLIEEHEAGEEQLIHWVNLRCAPSQPRRPRTTTPGTGSLPSRPSPTGGVRRGAADPPGLRGCLGRCPATPHGRRRLTYRPTVSERNSKEPERHGRTQTCSRNANTRTACGPGSRTDEFPAPRRSVGRRPTHGRPVPCGN